MVLYYLLPHYSSSSEYCIFFMINNGEHLIYIHIFDIWNISLQVEAYRDKSSTKILYLKKHD